MKLHHLKAWKPRASQWNAAAAHHLLLRCGFGAGPGEAQRLAGLKHAEAQAEVFGRDQHDPRLLRGAEALLSTGQIDRLSAWWMSLILGAGAPLRERVALMWHNHFATSMIKVQDHRMMHNQVQLFRERGLGDFRVLLHSIARDPAMLRWLDGDKNRAGNPNENFAREVMELFALGIGNYTEQDVKEAARAFTGWRESNNRFTLRKVDHDAGTKTILGQTGKFGTDEALDILIASPACARHIASRLLEEFVHPRPEPAWIDEAAQVLVDNEWHIERSLQVILASQLFYSPGARRSRISGPVEFMLGCARGLDLQARPASLVAWCREMGQALFHPNNVKGWDGMRHWINAGTWIVRQNKVHELCTNNSGRIQSTPEQLLAQLLPELVGSDFERRLNQSLAAQPKLRADSAQVAALICSAPEYHLV